MKSQHFKICCFVLLILHLFMFIHVDARELNNQKTTAKDTSKVKTKKSKEEEEIIKKLKLVDSMKVDLDSVSNDSDLESLSDSTFPEIEQTVDDTVTKAPPGHELLALTSKKEKYAYFDTTHSTNRFIDQNAFDVGEKLKFLIRYGIIKAGTATMSIPEIKTVKSRQCYHIITEAKSNRFFSTFFKVRDRVESYMDKNGLYTWRYEKHLREGKFKANQFVEYDHYDRIAVTDKKDTLRIPPCVQDILTSFYYVRTMPMEVGKSLYIDNHADRKLYPLEIRVYRKERIHIRAGSFDCVVIEPILRSDAIFKQRGRLLIWLTDDSRKIPVQMKSKVIIGSITAELVKMEGVMKSNEQVKL